MRYTPRERLIIALASILAAADVLFAVWIVARIGADALVPIHFDESLRPDGYGPAAWIFVLPIVSVLSVFVSVSRSLEMARERQVSFALWLASIITSLIALFLLTLVAGYAVWGTPTFVWEPTRFVHSALLVLVLTMLGHLAPRIATLPRNGTVGLRTPWTVSDDRVWASTHRLLGRLLRVLALLSCAVAVVWPHYGAAVFCVGVVVASFMASVYSWRIARPNQ